MGTRKRAGKQKTRGPYSDWNTAARTIKRTELDIVASICGTTRDTTGEVQRITSTNNKYDDGAAADERASESTTTVDSEPSNTTV